MHLQSCFFPKVIHNVYTNEDIVCRCGKCNACRNQRAENWVTRLDMEAQQHRFTMFFTLTYDDYSVPQAIRLRKDSYPNAAYISQSDGLLFDCRDIKGTFEHKDWKYISDTKVLNRLDKSDFQNFIKRLRYFFNETEKDAKLRYYLCGEYGPRTYRPHGHCLLFFDSKRCHNSIKELLSKAWSFGTVYDPHDVTGSAAQYCASYINSYYSLPRIYWHKELHPFTLFSKSPSIGAYSLNQERIKGFIESGTSKQVVFDGKKNSFIDVPFWRSFESGLYPRLARFGQLSPSDRITLYRLAEGFSGTAQELAQAIKTQYLDNCSIPWIRRYFSNIAYKTTYKFHFVDKEKSLPWYLKHLPFLPMDFVQPCSLQAYRIPSREFCFDSLVRFSRTIIRANKNAVMYGYSLTDYLTKLFAYYEKKDSLRIADYYREQNVFFASHPSWHLIYTDLNFYNKVRLVDYSVWSDATKATLFYLLYPTSMHVSPDVIDGSLLNHLKAVPQPDGSSILVLDIPLLEDTLDYKEMSIMQNKIAHDLVKTKENNDYAMQKKDKFFNVIQYQNN